MTPTPSLRCTTTPVVGLVTDNDETWQCGARTTSPFNVSTTKELIVDYRKRRAKQVPINIDRTSF
jgi:hypothetical protein